MRGGRGEWYVVGQAALVLAVVLAPFLVARASYPGAIVALGGVLCAAGLGVVIAGSIVLGRHRSLSPFPKPGEAASLAQAGVFSVVRHPIYSGLTLCAIGWSLIWSSPAALIAALALLVFFDIKARREERWLEAKFAGYAAYKARVRKLVPFIY